MGPGEAIKTESKVDVKEHPGRKRMIAVRHVYLEVELGGGMTNKEM